MRVYKAAEVRPEAVTQNRTNLIILIEMTTNNIPKRKRDKDNETSTLKRADSEIFNKTTKRKAVKKNLLSSQPTKSNFLQHTSPKKTTKAPKKTGVKKTTSLKKLNPAEKDTKAQRDTSVKTAKKIVKKKKEIQQKEQELTERKKIHLEYFMYKDNYVPVQNTEQRKIIFKIQLIDEKNQRTAKSVSKAEQETQVQAARLTDKGTQPTDRWLKITDFQCQTEQEAKPSCEDTNELTNSSVRPHEEDPVSSPVRACEQFEEESDGEKCFAETLSELEFLYLPDEKNFQGFSQTEKAHYKELFLCMAKKFAEKQPEMLDEATVIMLLQQRQLKQRGYIDASLRRGIPTHSPSIESYITNLFCYIEINDKSSLIDRLNSSYGYPLAEKFARVRTGQSIQRPASLIPETLFWQFESELHEELQFESEEVEQALHAHSKAIFDAVNEVMLEYQPFSVSLGEPFSWSENLENTFYCISDESFPVLVEQIRSRVYKCSHVLAGIILDTEGSDQNKYKAHINKILQNENLLISTEKKNQDKLEKDCVRTKLLCQVSDQIQNQIMNELAALLLTF